MADYDYDLFVIGAGSGGVRASRVAASYGVKVAIAEERFLGGTCVNVGCVPKKLFVYAAHVHEELSDVGGYGWQVGESQFHWQTLRENKDREIARLNGIYQQLLENSGVDLIEGRAQLVGPHTVKVGDCTYSCDKILISTGGRPFVPPLPGNEHMITSEDVFYLDHLPRRVAVVGGGYIAVEFASIFNGLGVETYLLYRGEQILRTFDRELADFAAEQYQEKGITIQCHTTISRIDKENDQLHCTLSDGEVLVVDAVLCATGRNPYLSGLGLENTTVQLNDDGKIKVDQYCQTTEPSIYALGDVTGGPELTPVAIAEAMAFVNTAFGSKPQVMDYNNIATAVFSSPNIAVVGLTEEQAMDKYAKVEVFRTTFRHLKHSITGNPEKTLMKLIVDAQTDKVIGAHMVGAEAGEIIQGIAIAIKAGATKADFDATVGIHPTAAEEFVTLR